MIKLLSFKKLYYQQRAFVRSSIYWMVRSDSVDDLVQDTFVKAWDKFDSFDQRSSFKTWIYRIAMNTTYDYLRKNKLESQKAKDYSTPEFGDDGIINKDLISYGLKQLDENLREVFILYYKLDYSILEIAEVVSIPQGTVKSRLFRAREIFQKVLKENGVEDE